MLLSSVSVFFFIFISLKSRRLSLNRPCVSKAKSVSRKFHSFSESKIMELKKVQMKRRSELKMMWAVRAFKEWQNNRLNDIEKFDIMIFEANLDSIENLTKETLEYALCRFVLEVTKLKSGDDYPGKTLYEMVVAIQKFVNMKGKNWKLVDDPDFRELRNVLDNVMKDRALRNIGMVKKQASIIPMNFESEMWRKGLLGEDTPDKLHDTMLFLIGINLGLRAGDEYQALRRHSPFKPSQFSFQKNDKGVRCIVYTEDTVTKTHDGGLNSMRKSKKVSWIYPSNEISQCPIHLIDKYMGLCPLVTEKNPRDNFYLKSLNRTNAAQWYSTCVLGIHSIRKTIKELLKHSELDGFFSNPTLR